jgi:hypothetical protein
MHAAAPQAELVREVDGRAIAGEAAQSRRDADGASGIGSDGSEGGAFLHAGGAAAGGTARQTCGVQGLRAIAVVGVFSGDAIGKLVEMCFADDQRALRTQASGDRRIGNGDSVGAGVVTRAATGGVAFEIETIFQGNGNPVESGLWRGAEAAGEREGAARGPLAIEGDKNIVAGVGVGGGEGGLQYG